MNDEIKQGFKFVIGAILILGFLGIGLPLIWIYFSLK